ncbi:hypothetical protein KVR01_013682 [Diaporthe batatas]|uniref:uncharacterized protein n=1 Tax=Diaporthe batatas TaxID=748121 RepID=UPI001D037296|nr:uncharacterized protein KVR01_013682 [Diaporthe batatas]KAG8156448.1 hypothetical protein KVR01_013682 [Diaporthe batatas]
MKLFIAPPSSQNRQVLTLAAGIGIVFLLYQAWGLHDRQLSLYPIDSPAPARIGFDAIPKKIWYKLGARGLSADAVAWTGSCMRHNPAYAVEFMTDLSADAWVAKTFAHRPDLVEAFLALNVQIIKADWLRYLLLYAEGGMWSDLDVSCNSPIESWIPPQYRENISMVVGWEFDTPWEGIGEAKHELATWTVLAKPGSPHMLTAIDGLLKGVQGVARDNGVDIAGITATPPMMGDIVTFCGPRRMTRSIFQSLRREMNMSDDDFRAVEEGSWFLLEPKLVGDVLILPGYAFSRPMNFYDEAFTDSLPPTLVDHHYAGTWKNEQGGEPPF